MTQFLLVMLIGVSFSCSNGILIGEDPEQFLSKYLSPETTSQIEFSLATLFFKRFEVIREETRIDNARFPELNATIPISDAYLYIDPNNTLAGLIEGEANFCNSTLNGLDTIEDVLNWEIDNAEGKINFYYNITAEDVNIKGQTSHALRIMNGLIRILGLGEYTVGVQGGYLELSLVININPITLKLTMSEFGLDIGFDNTTIYCEEGIINEAPVDFDILNMEIKETWGVVWPALQFLIESNIKPMFDSLLSNCTLLDLIGGNLDCLGTSLNDEILDSILLLPIEVEEAECATRTTYRTDPPLPTEPTTESPEAPPPNEGTKLGKIGSTMLIPVFIALFSIFL